MNPLLCPAAARSSQSAIATMCLTGWLCLAMLGWVALPQTTRATVFDFSAPLSLTAFNGGGTTIMLQVFDRGFLASTNIIAASAPFDLTVVGGVAAWSSGSTAYYYTYDPALMNFTGGTAALGASAFDMATTNGIVTWYANGKVYGRVYDRARRAWRAMEVTSTSPSGLRTVDGVVAWSSSGGTYFAAYDPTRGTWMNGSVPTALPNDLRNTNGVVAWSKSTTVYSYIYDPTRNGWQGTNVVNTTTINDLRNQNGVVAWSSGSLVKSQVYDPSRGRWMGSTVNSGAPTFDLNIVNSTVTWTAGAQSFVSGYNPGSGAWGGPAAPLAWFAVSTNAGNAPLVVNFMDMSLAGASWSWDLGNGQTTNARSFTWLYTNFTPITVTQTITSAVGVPSSANLFIKTDISPPSGSIVINSNAALTITNVVFLTLAAIDNSGVVSYMRFSNDGLSYSPLEPYATSKVWTLSGLEAGTRTVSVQFADALTNLATATDTITFDPTPQPTVRVISTNVMESAGSVNFFLQLDHPLNRQVSIYYFTSDGTATAGEDYTAVSNRVDFAPNETLRVGTVPITQDAKVELHESFQINLLNVTNAMTTGSGTVVILDDDPASVSFASTNFSAFENEGVGHVSLWLNAPSGSPVTVRFSATNGTALSGSDFLATNLLVTIPPGQTNLSVSVRLIDDAFDELPETILLRLTSVTNGIFSLPTNATLTILDEDAPRISFAAASLPVFEDEGVAVIHVLLSKPFLLPVEVDYTAFGGSAAPGVFGDYLPANGRLTFPTNVTERIFFVNLVNDSTAEPDKTIHLTLSGFSGALPGTFVEADILLWDDDGAPRLLSPRLTTNGLFAATARGKTNQVFALESSPQLPATGLWMPLASFTNATGTLEITAPESTNRFRVYRTRVGQ
jgi:Calx-beta domain